MRHVKQIGKILLSGMLAVVILCLIFSFYLTTPVHIPSTKGNTDYVWPANSRWTNMREGISWGQYDADGFNNPAVIENPDILILGSSHMEATNVLQEETVGVRLTQLLDGDYSVYNMGISGHTFLKICKYLPVSLSLGDVPPQVVVIETSTVFFSGSDVASLRDGTVEFTPSHNTGLLASLQKLPFFRTLYRQVEYGLLDLFLPRRSSAPASTSQPAGEPVPGDYDILFQRIAVAVDGRDIQVVIFYHPMEQLQSDGSMGFAESAGKALFQEKCGEYGYTFLDMTEPFQKMYETEHLVAHGFSTGQLCTGHLNANGHRVIAQELARIIREMEEGGTLCR